VAIDFLICAFDDRIFLLRGGRRDALKCREAVSDKACNHVVQELRFSIRMNDARACEFADEID
jgi:hypothetical protein